MAHLDAKFRLEDGHWEESEALTNALEPVFSATKISQKEQLYFGDFYKLWLETKLTIRSMENVYSKTLAECIESREKSLTSNEVVLSAICLDPRLRRALLQNPIQLIYARSHLTKVMRQISAMKKW